MDQSVQRLTTEGTVRGSNLDERRYFPHPSRQALGAHPASYTMGTGSFPEIKRTERGVDHPPAFSKGKPIPLQARTGPEGSRRLRLPDFKTIGT